MGDWGLVTVAEMTRILEVICSDQPLIHGFDTESDVDMPDSEEGEFVLLRPRNNENNEIVSGPIPVEQNFQLRIVRPPQSTNNTNIESLDSLGNISNKDKPLR